MARVLDMVFAQGAQEYAQVVNLIDEETLEAKFFGGQPGNRVVNVVVWDLSVMVGDIVLVDPEAGGVIVKYSSKQANILMDNGALPDDIIIDEDVDDDGVVMMDSSSSSSDQEEDDGGIEQFIIGKKDEEE